MSNNKKKILFISECSVLATGFSNYGREIIQRIYDSDKYEIAELGTYVKQSDPRLRTVPWKVYGAVPEDHNAAALEEYNKAHEQWGRRQNLGQFGAVVLNDVLLDFQPDYVCSWLDPWMVTIQADTPLRKLYRWIYMPCIDSTPQRQEWLKMYETADYLLGYSDFAVNVMMEQSPKIKTGGSKKLYPMPARPGVDINTFKPPADKGELRHKWRLNPDIPLVVTCMRNQQRKLFCDLIDSFAQYKKENPNDPTAQKAALLIHSTGYDAGQEYWEHIRRLSSNKYMKYYYDGLYRHILHTFQCDGCGVKHIGFAIHLLNARMSNGKAYIKCPACGQQKARTPNTSMGYSREELAEIFGLADLYVQVSIAGADEMPITEAKACGIPVLASANAAMLEKTIIPLDYNGEKMTKRADGKPYSMNKGGIPIKIGYEFVEAATMQLRCYFDRKDLTNKFKILSDKQKLQRLSKAARESVLENCDYDDTVKIWEYVFDNLPAKDRSTTWDKEIKVEDLPQPTIKVPADLTDDQFVDFCYKEILGKKDVDEVGKTTWLENLQQGRSRREVVEYFAQVATQDNSVEILITNYRQRVAQQKDVEQILQKGNMLQGILVC